MLKKEQIEYDFSPCGCDWVHPDDGRICKWSELPQDLKITTVKENIAMNQGVVDRLSGKPNGGQRIEDSHLREWYNNGYYDP